MGTVLRDAVWGDVELGARELALIDTEAFQRLRRVRQLGFTELVFPGAHHTRFEHSIGVFHLAGVLLRRLAQVGGGPVLSRSDRDAFLAAALLHDVGHYPFSHAVEELEMGQIRPHAEIARDVIASDEVRGVLESSWELDPHLVSALVAGPAAGAELGPTLTLLRTAIDSGLDVDKLDYLVRDARAANVPYGLVDVQRLIASLVVTQEGDAWCLAVGRGGVAALESLVFAKHLMFATVYWHHACRAAVAMLLRAVQEALEAAALGPRELERADDATLIAMLLAPGMPEPTRALAGRLRGRRLYKRAAEITVDDGRFAALEELWFDPSRRRQVEDSWAARAGAPASSLLLDIPEPRRIVVDLPVVDGFGRAGAWDEAGALGHADLDRVQTWARRIRVFASSTDLARAFARTREEAPWV